MNWGLRRKPPATRLVTRVALSAVAFALLVPVAARAAGEAEWIEVRTPHFTLAGDVRDADLRRIGIELERLRAIYQHSFGDIRLDSGRPMTILVFRNTPASKNFIPDEKERKPWTAEIVHGAEKDYMVIRTGAVNELISSLLVGAYARFLRDVNFGWLPAWLQVGLGTVLSQVVMSGRTAVLGATPHAANFYYLRTISTVPLEELVTWDGKALPGDKARESANLWETASVLTHMLLFDPLPGHPVPLVEVIESLEQGMDSLTALQHVLGEKTYIERKVRAYAAPTAVRGFSLAAPPEVPPGEVPVRTMTPAEVTAAQGEFALEEKKLDVARPLLEKAIALDPKLPAPRVNLALLCIRQGKFDEAAKYLSGAPGAGESAYLKFYALGRMLGVNKDDSPSSAGARENLTKAVTADPDFSPAYAALAEIYLASDSAEERVKAAEPGWKAVSLDPGSGEFSLLLGRALAASGQGSLARRALLRAFGAAKDDEERAAANLVLEQLPALLAAAPKPPAPPKPVQAPISATAVPEPPPPGKSADSGQPDRPALKHRPPPAPGEPVRAEGRVAEVRCSGFGLQLTFESRGKTFTLRAENYVEVTFDEQKTRSEGVKPCSELAGRGARILYKPDPAKPDAGELVSVTRLGAVPAAPSH